MTSCFFTSWTYKSAWLNTSNPSVKHNHLQEHSPGCRPVFMELNKQCFVHTVFLWAQKSDFWKRKSVLQSSRQNPTQYNGSVLQHNTCNGLSLSQKQQQKIRVKKRTRENKGDVTESGMVCSLLSTQKGPAADRTGGHRSTHFTLHHSPHLCCHTGNRHAESFSFSITLQRSLHQFLWNYEPNSIYQYNDISSSGIMTSKPKWQQPPWQKVTPKNRDFLLTIHQALGKFRHISWMSVEK